jgi:WD40 repeat protein
MESGARSAHLRAHTGTISDLKFRHDGRYVYTGSDDGLVKQWDTATWKPINILDAGEGSVATLDISPNDESVAVGYQSGAIVLWNTATYKPRYRIGGHVRDHGSCNELAEQKWVDDQYRLIVARACSSGPGAYFDRFAKRSHLRINEKLEIVPDWE